MYYRLCLSSIVFLLPKCSIISHHFNRKLFQNLTKKIFLILIQILSPNYDQPVITNIQNPTERKSEFRRSVSNGIKD